MVLREKVAVVGFIRRSRAVGKRVLGLMVAEEEDLVD